MHLWPNTAPAQPVDIPDFPGAYAQPDSGMGMNSNQIAPGFGSNTVMNIGQRVAELRRIGA